MEKNGRPPNWETPEELQAEIDAYFENTPEEEWTITGLALALDTSRQTLLDYQGKDGFSDTVKKAKLKVENGYEKDLKKHGRSGTIFALKNFDWKDKTEVDNNVFFPKPLMTLDELRKDISNNEDSEPNEED